MSKPVLIAGAGVVGCLLGHVLKKHNIPFKILEQSSAFKKIPYRTVALTKDSILFLNTLDKSLDLNDWTTPVEKMELFHKNDLGIVLDSNDDQKVTSIGLLSNLHEKLLKNVQSEILWNTTVTGISIKDTVVVETTQNEFETEFIFATDGSNSKVRELCDFENEEWFYGQKAYVTCIRAEHNNIAKQYFTKNGTLALLPLNDEEQYYSVIFCTNSTGNVTHDLQDMNKQFNINLNLTNLKLGAGFELKHSRALKLYSDNVLLCGDAANTFHPMAGQGLNLGIGDVMEIEKNLLDLIQNKKEALMTYSKKRNNKNLQMTWIIQSLFGAFGNVNSVTEKILNSGMKILDKAPGLKQRIINYANKN
jgi:2-polyprenyl-6-methoxyphenol hydroxylase-like FAD-dependent oxidoreductase